jgi:UDP-2,4-diacetamido-2,4,6-trideoxy-beta-L-altropyranose hydrolase
MSIKLHIRADGSPEIGMGHLIRSLSLAKMVHDLADIHFYSLSAPQSFLVDLDNAGVTFHSISADVELIEYISSHDVVIIDHYELDETFHKLVRATGAYLICIDDMHNKPFDADLIVNHSPGVLSSAYQAKPYTKFALGPEYALLRPEFLEAASKREIRGQNRKLLVCFGGSDYLNLSCRALKILYRNDYFEEIHIITGSEYKYGSELAELADKDRRVIWFENRNAIQMLLSMQECYYALAPSSGISYEILSAGCFWFGGYYVDNQKNIYDGFRQFRCMLELGDLRDGIESINTFMLQSNWQEKISKMDNPIDGKSGSRINNLINSYVRSVAC